MDIRKKTILPGPQMRLGYGADGSRIALSGTSAGGQLAALMGSVTDSKELFRPGRRFRISGQGHVHVHKARSYQLALCLTN